MTIKNRLILSHVLVFIVPLVMTAVLFLVALGGIWLFTHSGNPIYVCLLYTSPSPRDS